MASTLRIFPSQRRWQTQGQPERGPVPRAPLLNRALQAPRIEAPSCGLARVGEAEARDEAPPATVRGRSAAWKGPSGCRASTWRTSYHTLFCVDTVGFVTLVAAMAGEHTDRIAGAAQARGASAIRRSCERSSTRNL